MKIHPLLKNLLQDLSTCQASITTTSSTSGTIFMPTTRSAFCLWENAGCPMVEDEPKGGLNFSQELAVNCPHRCDKDARIKALEKELFATYPQSFVNELQAAYAEAKERIKELEAKLAEATKKADHYEKQSTSWLVEMGKNEIRNAALEEAAKEAEVSGKTTSVGVYAHYEIAARIRGMKK